MLRGSTLRGGTGVILLMSTMLSPITRPTFAETRAVSCFDVIAKLITKYLGVPEDKIKLTSNFINDLGADSLDTVELCMSFEKEFGVDIPADEADKMLTPGHVIHYLTDLGVCRNGLKLSETFNTAPSLMLNLTDASFDSEVIQSAEPVVVFFWAEWCGPCRMIAPALEKIAHEMNGKVKIVKLNVDENPGVASKYGIRSIPTLMVFKHGKHVATKIGAGPKDELSRWINANI